jgi:hypothetical protein
MKDLQDSLPRRPSALTAGARHAAWGERGPSRGSACQPVRSPVLGFAEPASFARAVDDPAPLPSRSAPHPGVAEPRHQGDGQRDRLRRRFSVADERPADLIVMGTHGWGGSTIAARPVTEKVSESPLSRLPFRGLLRID